MPIYVYREILEDGAEGETFEVLQSMQEPSLTEHPQTGRPVRRVYLPPNVGGRYNEQGSANRLSNKRIESLGFTKYEKDKLTGRYHKVAGKDSRAPDHFDKPKLG